MNVAWGEALAGFDTALAQFRTALADEPDLCARVFDGTADWEALLTHKLVPHMAGEGCLVVAVAGGTNTGKSTLFNLLLGQDISPMRATAAATRHTLLAGHPSRAAQALEGRLLPDFLPAPLEDPDAMVQDGAPFETLYVTEVADLPERLVILDTPDVDSIDRQNWEVADNIRAAGDVLVAVITAEKYKDARVVDFFRRARAAGRILLPLMNKADPADDFAVARQQLVSFREDVGLEDGPSFVLAHDFAVGADLARPVLALDGDGDLRDYLRSLDVSTIKAQVFEDTLRHFARETAVFLERCDSLAARMTAATEEFTGRAGSYAAKYDPAPGTKVGGLFHDFVQSKRGPLRRAIGSASATVARTLGALGKAVTGALRERAQFEAPPHKKVDTEIRALHAEAIERIARDLLTSYMESARNLAPPAGPLVERGLDDVNVAEAARCVTEETLEAQDVSEAFRRHARKTLDAWWESNARQRHALEALDTILAAAPAAIALPISMYTAGIGVPEAITVAGPFVEQFVARVLEYQFGDQMFDLLSPWKKEQQAHLETALIRHVAGPALTPLAAARAAFEDGPLDDMKRWSASWPKD